MQARRSRWESRETSTGRTESELVDLLEGEIGEARAGEAGGAGRGAGDPGHHRPPEEGIALSAVNLPIERPPDPRSDHWTCRPAGLRRQRRQPLPRLPSTLRRGARGRGVVDADHRDRDRRGADPGGRGVPRDDRGRRRARPRRHRHGRPSTARATARVGAVSRRTHPGRRWAAKAARRLSGSLDSALGKMRDGRARDRRQGRHRGRALRGTRPPPCDLRPGRAPARRRRSTSFANIFEPDVFVDRRRRWRRHERTFLLDPARAEIGGRALHAVAPSRWSWPSSVRGAGMIGAAAMARIELKRSAV